MPALDFRQARTSVRLAEVLDLLGFKATSRRGEQLRGPCPLHGSRTPASRSFAADLGKNAWHCFGCGAGGNVLDLWVALTGQPLYAAVIDLYGRLGRDVPWLRYRPQQEKPTMPEP
jgi:DNA primase